LAWSGSPNFHVSVDIERGSSTTHIYETPSSSYEPQNIAEARELFERLLSLRNDDGLLAEEFDPRLGRQVGNFSQAFSHVALVNTAFNLTRTQGPAEQRARAGHRKPRTAAM
jgi:hypothetical protein